MPPIQTKQLSPFWQWLTPSWLSGLIAVSAGLALTIGAIIVFSLHNSSFEQQLVIFQSSTPQPSLTAPGQAPPGSNNNTIQNTWPVILFWASVGLGVYFLIETITHFVSTEREVLQEINYVHADRHKIIKTNVELLIFRLLVLIFWVIFINVFFKRLIPYAVTAASVSASDLASLSGLIYGLLAFGLVAIGCHINVLFLRLYLRRTRIIQAII